MKIRKIAQVLMWMCIVGVLGLLLSVQWVDRWLFYIVDPGVFAHQERPRAPDYTKQSAWAALPTRKEGADISVNSHPARDPAQTKVDVFYVHPTTWVGRAWNAPFTSPSIQKAVHRGALLIQASAFNACCAVYAPHYRQAQGKAFTTYHPDGRRAIDLAYSDVRRAFVYFRKHFNKGRPFIVASHSQGTVLAERLLKEEIWNTPAQKDWVVSYLIGGPVYRSTLGQEIPVCKKAQQTGCVVAWNARGPRYTSNRLEFVHPTQRHTKDRMLGRICVNPLTWKQDEVLASNVLHQGAIFFDAKKPRIIKAFANAQCKQGRLLITKMKKPIRDTMSRILDWMMGPDNYHPFEYQLYYLNIRSNALLRSQAFVRKRK